MLKERSKLSSRKQLHHSEQSTMITTKKAQKKLVKLTQYGDELTIPQVSHGCCFHEISASSSSTLRCNKLCYRKETLYKGFTRMLCGCSIIYHCQPWKNLLPITLSKRGGVVLQLFKTRHIELVSQPTFTLARALRLLRLQLE